MRTYKRPHSSKLKPAAQAEADYREGKYENKNSVFSPEHDEYKKTYSELTLAEPLEQRS